MNLNDTRHAIREWAYHNLPTLSEEDIRVLADAVLDVRPHLTYTALPIRDEYGICHEFRLMRSDMKHLTRVDLDLIRDAFGQSPLDDAEYPSGLADDDFFPA